MFRMISVVMLAGGLAACAQPMSQTRAGAGAGPAAIGQGMASAGAGVRSSAEARAAIARAVAGEHRRAEDRARDRWRNPEATLAFFGLEPGMTVVEIWPASGWYADIIAPVVAQRGRYVAAHFPEGGSEMATRARQNFVQRFTASPALHGRVEVTSFGRADPAALAPPASADLIVSFRNVHSWRGQGFADEAFRAMYAALRPGGVLGIVQHRLPEDRPDDDTTRQSGYVKESQVVRMASAAGFRLDARSEINANPRDTADHPEGVWTLPPVLRLGERDRERWLAVGESDRMTLRFVKPAA